MALMTPQANNGVLAPVYAAPTVSDTIQWTPGLHLYVKVGATATTITVAVPGTEEFTGAAVPDLVVGPVTNGDRWILIPELAANPTTGLVTVTYSQVVNVTAALVRAAD